MHRVLGGQFSAQISEFRIVRTHHGDADGRQQRHVKHVLAVSGLDTVAQSGQRDSEAADPKFGHGCRRGIEMIRDHLARQCQHPGRVHSEHGSEESTE